MKRDLIAERHPTICYKQNGMIFVPHFSYKNLYVAPGYFWEHNKTFKESELQQSGAQPVIEQLLSRPKSGAKNV
jgi:hypothetical protein